MLIWSHQVPFLSTCLKIIEWNNFLIAIVNCKMNFFFFRDRFVCRQIAKSLSYFKYIQIFIFLKINFFFVEGLALFLLSNFNFLPLLRSNDNAKWHLTNFKVHSRFICSYPNIRTLIKRSRNSNNSVKKFRSFFFVFWKLLHCKKKIFQKANDAQKTLQSKKKNPKKWTKKNNQ